MTVLHKINGAASSRRDDGNTRRKRFLNCLAKGLVNSSVGKNVERRIQLGKLLPACKTSEVCCWHHFLQLFATWSIANNHHRYTRQGRYLCKPFNLFLTREPADKSNDDVLICA